MNKSRGFCVPGFIVLFNTIFSYTLSYLGGNPKDPLLQGGSQVPIGPVLQGGSHVPIGPVSQTGPTTLINDPVPPVIIKSSFILSFVFIVFIMTLAFFLYYPLIAVVFLLLIMLYHRQSHRCVTRTNPIQKLHIPL